MIKVKKLKDGAALSRYAHPSDTAFDFFLCEDDIVPPMATGYLVRLGIAVEISKGYYMEIHLRSSTALKTPLRLANNVGIIDEGYRIAQGRYPF